MKISELKAPIILLAFHIFLFVCGFFYLQAVDKSTALILSSSFHIFEPILHFILLAVFLVFFSIEDQVNKQEMKARQRLFLLGGLTVCSVILPKELGDLGAVFYICMVYAPIALLFFRFPIFKEEKPFILELLQFAGYSVIGALFLFGFFYLPLLFIPITVYAFYIKEIRLGIIVLSVLNFIAATYYYVMFFIMARFLSQPTTCLMALVGLFVMESYIISNRYLFDKKEALSEEETDEII